MVSWDPQSKGPAFRMSTDNAKYFLSLTTEKTPFYIAPLLLLGWWLWWCLCWCSWLATSMPFMLSPVLKNKDFWCHNTT